MKNIVLSLNANEESTGRTRSNNFIDLITSGNHCYLYRNTGDRRLHFNPQSVVTSASLLQKKMITNNHVNFTSALQ